MGQPRVEGLPVTATASAPPSSWRDRKRPLWLLSLLVPALAGAGPAAWLWLRQDWVLWMPLVLVYVLIPLLDLLVGEDRSNPPESAVPALEADRYYRHITWALVPLLWLAIVFAAWFVMRHPLPLHGLVAVVLSTGVVGGFCINVGHELGHKRDPIEQWLARLVLAPTAYGHFTVEHNRGHHRDVATPQDPASARMGESIYAFALREVPGAWRRAFVLERERLGRAGRPWWHLDNELVKTGLVTLGLHLVLVLWLGPAVWPFLVAASLWANFQLTSANYIEHYGLRRRVGADGRPEPCRPEHSWNSNHLVSNWALFQLQRHADHHAHATRRYQSLRHFPDAPQLPTGYFGMFVLAYVPPLFFRVMDRRLLERAGRDPEGLNLHPPRREALLRRYRLHASG